LDVDALLVPFTIALALGTALGHTVSTVIRTVRVNDGLDIADTTCIIFEVIGIIELIELSGFAEWRADLMVHLIKLEPVIGVDASMAVWAFRADRTCCGAGLAVVIEEILLGETLRAITIAVSAEAALGWWAFSALVAKVLVYAFTHLVPHGARCAVAPERVSTASCHKLLLNLIPGVTRRSAVYAIEELDRGAIGVRGVVAEGVGVVLASLKCICCDLCPFANSCAILVSAVISI